MKLIELITTEKTSSLLNRIGINTKSTFSYFKNKDGHVYASETDFSKDEFLSYAYTSEELINFLPANLEIGVNNYVVSFDGKKYNNITKSDVEKYEYAELISLKIPSHLKEEDKYLTKYCINNRVIALSQNQKGEYRNLICFGKTETESRAKMIVELVEEGIL